MNRCLVGDCRESMRSLIAQGVQVQMCVTSPPYWGLRDYGHPGQLGLEPTIGEYVANMVDVFRLVREMMTDDGTLWLNLGDSYASGGRGGGMEGPEGEKQRSNVGALLGPKRPTDGLKPKDLCGIPWRVAFALQTDGWWLRQDIIWAKPNPMPESVTDRCTKSHEYLFLLAKSERYLCDMAAIAEDAIGPAGGNVIPTKGAGTDLMRTRNGLHLAQQRARENGGFEKRNKRSVWAIATESYAEAHFATFPQALVEPCVLAGSRPGDIVFDPFLGSGTTAQVAQRLGRQWLGCELNPAYVALQDDRTRQPALIA